MNDIKFTTIDELIKLESLRARKKPPCDLQINEKGLELEQYYSESKKGHLNLLEMPLDYLVRAFNKTLKKLNEKEPLKKFLNSNEYDSKAFKKLLLKSENAPNQMNNYIDLLYSNYER